MEKIFKNNIFIIPFRFITLLILISVFNTSGLNGQNTAKQRSPTGLYLRAPDVIPGTIAEMRDPAYWIQKMQEPDKVILTVEEIEKKNRDFLERMNDPGKLSSNLGKRISQELASRPGLMTSVPDPGRMKPDELKGLISSTVSDEIKFLTGRRYGNILGIEYSPAEIKAIVEEISYNQSISQQDFRDGITVRDCRLCIIPSLREEYKGFTGLAGWDMWNFDVLPVACPVSVLHISKSGAFFLVLTARGIGWVRSEDIALARKEGIEGFVGYKDFIICTGDRVPFYSDRSCSYVSGWMRMGDRLPATDSENRMIQIPVRNTNGTLAIQEAWLKPDADVHRGYLPFTTKNVAVQVFKLQDNIYDWTGGWSGRDHATQLRDIFSVFGFRLPSMGGMLTAFSSSPRILDPKEGQEAQYKAILAGKPFLTIQICNSGHSQLFLGDNNGVPVVFDTHGYRYNDSEGNELVIRRANVGTVLFPDYFLRQEISFVDLW